MREIIAAILIIAVVLVGCQQHPVPDPEELQPVPEKEEITEEIDSQINDLDTLDTELTDEELEQIEADLADIDW